MDEEMDEWMKEGEKDKRVQWGVGSSSQWEQKDKLGRDASS
jgi:hypothetical protein